MISIHTIMTSKLFIILAFLYFEKFTYSAEIASRLNESESGPVYESVVVGLGTSGLTAFSKMARRGRRVLGLEAMDRIGGRVNTLRVPGGSLVEIGAEWIHGRNNSRTYELALRYNLTIKHQALTMKMTRSDGTEVDMDLTNQLVQNCLEAESNNTQAEPVGKVLTRNCKEYISKNRPELLKDPDYINELLTMFNFMYITNEGSDDWNDATFKSNYEDLDDNLAASWHTYGYNTLIEIILNKYNNGEGLPATAEIKLNKEVVEILWTRDPNANIKLKCRDGSEYEAKDVIVTVSLGVLKEKYTSLFSPSVPRNKVTAIQNISMGVVDKIILFFDQAWWSKDANLFLFLWKSEDKAKVPVEDEWTTQISYASCSMSSDNVLELWSSGKAARYIETLSDEFVKNKTIELLRKFMKKDAPEPTDIIKSSWYTNPFTRGSYTYDNLQTPEHPRLREQLSEPLIDTSGRPRVLFAGEATNPTHYGTVHGAFETGIREANRLLAVDTNSLD